VIDLHSTGFVVAVDAAVLLAVVFWLGLAFWVYRDARKRIGDPFLVFLATLVGLALPYIGSVVYLLFRPSDTLDDVRSRRVELQALEQQLVRLQPRRAPSAARRSSPATSPAPSA
jgi:hypothetical protein